VKENGSVQENASVQEDGLQQQEGTAQQEDGLQQQEGTAQQEDGLQQDAQSKPLSGGRRIEVLVPMRWGDMDAYGHINNVQIVRMLEEARIAAFGPPRGAGLPGIEPHVSLFNDVPEGTMALVVDHRIRYVRTLEYRNVPAVVQVWIGAVKGASFDIHYLVQDPVTREDCVKASSHLAFVHEATGRVQRLTPEQKERLAPFTA
jgi:acyl-CoA thioester hydrolase